ncbi:MAG: hypothetical protein RLZZ592_211 [Pseudomonadota bacterium]|jgi:type IV fimbrial biogenesis protein FimT
MNTRQGLTLPELLLTLALLALLATQALPSLSAQLHRRRLLAASDALMADLQLLREATVAQHRALRLSLHELPEGSCRLLHDGEAGDCRCEADTRHQPRATCRDGTRVLRATLLPRDLRLLLRANVASLRADPRQGTITPTGSIELVGLDSEAPVLRHVVNIMGRTRRCTPAAPLAGVPRCA